MLAVAMFVLAAWGCSGGGSSSSPSTSSTTPSSSSGAVTVTIMGQRNEQSFSPNPVPIAQGSLIVWQNSDNTVHRIVMNDGSFDSGNISPGAMSTTMRLSSNGGSYHCAIHPTTMFGSVNVPTTPPPPTDPGSSY
jgi:plastocyanin